MAHICVRNITYQGKNPDGFLSSLQFRFQCEVMKNNTGNVEWKFIYFYDKDEKFDQVLDTIHMKDLNRGQMQFDVAIKAPDPSKIPQNQLLGMGVILVAGFYEGNEFFRVGYYVNNQIFNNGVALTEEQIQQVRQQNINIPFDKIQRNILLSKPRVTRKPIDWNAKQQENQLKQQMQLSQENLQLPQNFLGDKNYKNTINQGFNALFGMQNMQQQQQQQQYQGNPLQQNNTFMNQQMMMGNNNQMGQKSQMQNSLFNY